MMQRRKNKKMSRKSKRLRRRIKRKRRKERRRMKRKMREEQEQEEKGKAERGGGLHACRPGFTFPSHPSLSLYPSPLSLYLPIYLYL